MAAPIQISYKLVGDDPKAISRRIGAAFQPLGSPTGDSGGNAGGGSVNQKALKEAVRLQEQLTTLQTKGEAQRTVISQRAQEQVSTIAARETQKRIAFEEKAQQRRIVSERKAAADIEVIESQLAQRLEAIDRRRAAGQSNFFGVLKRNASTIREAGEALQNAGFASLLFTQQLQEVGKSAISSAVDIDRQVNVLRAFTGSAQAAELRFKALFDQAQRTPGLTTQLGATLDAQLRTASVTEKTIDKTLDFVGRLNAVSVLGDPQKFAQNLVQLVSQGFERTDLKELVGNSPLAGEVLKALFKVDSPTNAKAIRESAEKLGIKTAEDFLTALANQAAKDPRLGQVTESIGTQFDKLRDRVTVALRPLGLVLIETLVPAVNAAIPIIEKLSSDFAKMDPVLRQVVVGIGLLAVAAGPLLIALGAIVQSGGAVLNLLAVLGGVTGFGGVAAATGAAGTATAAFASGLVSILGTAALVLGALGALYLLYSELTEASGRLTGTTLQEAQSSRELSLQRQAEVEDLANLIETGKLSAGVMSRLNEQYEKLTPAQQARVNLLEKEAGATDTARGRAEALLAVQRELAEVSKTEAAARTREIASDFLVLAQRASESTEKLATMRAQLDRLTATLEENTKAGKGNTTILGEFGTFNEQTAEAIQGTSKAIQEQIKLDKEAQAAVQRKAAELKIAAQAAQLSGDALLDQLDTFKQLPTSYENAARSLREFNIEGKLLGPRLQQTAKEARVGAEAIGINIVQGSIAGIQKTQGNYWEAVRQFMQVGTNVAKETVRTQSPSLVFKEIGSNIGEGLVIGITAKRGEVAKAAKELAQGAVKEARAGAAEVQALLESKPKTRQALADKATAQEFKSELETILDLRRKLGEPLQDPLPKTFAEAVAEAQRLKQVLSGEVSVATQQALDAFVAFADDQLEVLKDSYDSGLVSTREYFDNRFLLTEAKLEKELALIQEQAAQIETALSKAPKGAPETVALQEKYNEVVGAGIEKVRELNSNLRDNAAAFQKAGSALQDANLDLQVPVVLPINAEFEKLPPILQQARKELQALRELAFATADGTPISIDPEAFQKQLESGKAISRVNLIDLEIRKQVEIVQNQVNAGIISEAQGRKNLLAIEAQYRDSILAALDAERQLAELQGDPIRAANIAIQIEQYRMLGVELDGASRFMRGFGGEVEDVGDIFERFGANVSRAFRNTSDLLSNLKNAVNQFFRDLAGNVLQNVVGTGLNAILGKLGIGGQQAGAGSSGGNNIFGGLLSALGIGRQSAAGGGGGGTGLFAGIKNALFGGSATTGGGAAATPPSISGLGSFALKIPNLPSLGTGFPATAGNVAGAVSSFSQVGGFKGNFLAGGAVSLLPALLGAGLGAGLGGRSPLGQILGAVGGGAVGLGLSFGASVLGAGGGFGAAALAALGPAALIGLPLLVGAILLGRRKQRAADEATSGEYLQDAVDGIAEMRKQAERGIITNVEQARSIFEQQIIGTFIAQIKTLKTKSVVESRLTNQVADLRKLFEDTVVPAILQAIKDAKVFKKLEPEFHKGQLLSNETRAIILKDEMVLTKDQQHRVRQMAGYDVFTFAGVPNAITAERNGVPFAHSGGVMNEAFIHNRTITNLLRAINYPNFGVPGGSPLVAPQGVPVVTPTPVTNIPFEPGSGGGPFINISLDGMRLTIGPGDATEVVGLAFSTADGKRYLAGAMDEVDDSHA